MSSLNLGLKLKNLTFKQVIILMLATSLLIASAGVATYLGVNVNVDVDVQGRLDSLENRQNYIEGNLSVTWNPTFYTTQGPFSFVIASLESYYTLQNGTSGQLKWYSTSLFAVESAAVGNLTSGTIYCKNVAWNDSISVVGSILVIEDLNGVIRYISNNRAQYTHFSMATYTVDYNQTVPNNYTAVRYDGKILLSSTSSSQVIISAIANVPTGGGKIMLLGIINLDAEIPINRNGIEICGENTGGDLYFSRDGTYHGVTNKSKTVVVAFGITAFHIGSATFNQGLAIRDLTITGNISNAALSWNDYTTGAGINITRGNTIKIENVWIVGKEYGMYCSTGGFAWDKVIDCLTLETVYFSYNLYGFWSDGWVADSLLHNVRGYLNGKGLIHAAFQYNVLIDTVSSQSDNVGSTAYYEVPIYITTHRDVTFNNIVIQGATDVLYGLMLLDISNAFGAEPRIIIDNIVLLGSGNSGAAYAIGVIGDGGKITVNDIHAGVGGDDYLSWYGGDCRVGTVVFLYDSCLSKVTVNGGIVNSTIAERNWWFYSYESANQIICNNVKGISDFGAKTIKFAPTAFGDGTYSVGFMGTDAAPTANRIYVVSGVNMMLKSAGGTGVNITISDQIGYPIWTNVSTLNATYLPNGFMISFGDFSVAPDVETFYC